MRKIVKKFIEANINKPVKEVYNADMGAPSSISTPIVETPIDKFEKIGNWDKGSSFTSPVDRKILSNPNAVQKIKDKFANTDFIFDMYFVNSKEGRKYSEEGEVTEDFIRNKLKLDTPINQDHITVFYTNNKGDQRVMMTAWIIAHRFGHVIRKMEGWERLQKEVDENIQRLLEEVYGRKIPRIYGLLGGGIGGNDDDNKILKNFAQSIGTFKSARDKNLRNYFEFHYELLAQYITTGKISFNPLPKYIPVKYAYGKPTMGLRTNASEHDMEYYQGYLESLAQDVYPDYADEALRGCLGRIFVM